MIASALTSKTKFLRQLPYASPGFLGIGGKPPQGLRAQNNIVKHGQIFSQGEMLVHHADPGGQGSRGLARRQDKSINLYCSCIGHIVAEQDIHQRGFARAIFTKQPKYFAPLKRQRNIIIGQQGAKPLGDA